MTASPDTCPFREPLTETTARCSLVSQVLADDCETLDRVERQVCQACCRSLPTNGSLNPVVASLVYTATSRIVREGNSVGGAVERAERIQQWVTSHLGFEHEHLANRSFPPLEVTRQVPAADRSGPSRVWSIGLLTAPRTIPTLQHTLASLAEADFSTVQIFAEPGSWIPDDRPGGELILHARRLGNFVNFYSALDTLYQMSPEADCYAMFQDDVSVARGLRSWCDEQLWPLGAGVVSLFTPWVRGGRRPGWRLDAPGFHRVFGAQALVFRRDLLEQFLADVQILRELQAARHNDDALVSAWATRNGHGIAYHTPSLVQHVGHASSIYRGGPDRRVVADAVGTVESIATWGPSPRQPGKLGLVGWHTPTGLGYQNEDLARHLDVDRWLIPDHPHYPTLSPQGLPCRRDYVPPNVGLTQIQAWLQSMDWVLFVERPYLPKLAQAARAQQVSVACVPNWEWTHPQMDWLNYVDLMICPTQLTYAHCRDWKQRFGFGWDLMFLPWPIDTDRFRFRPRTRCLRYVFVNGWGGGRATYLTGHPAPYLRKGAELIAEVADACPDLSFIVYSQQSKLPKFPAHVEVRPPPEDHRRLYDDGDVCVQPSHWEGLGMQLLECQAAGMPLITTDAPPMNEYEPLRTIPVETNEVVALGEQLFISSQRMCPRKLGKVLTQLQGADIRDASHKAREFVERAHCWHQAQKSLAERFVTF